MSSTANETPSKRYFSNEIFESPLELVPNSKRGKHTEDFDILSSISDDSFNEINSVEARSFRDDVQSISSGSAEHLADDGDITQSIHLIGDTISCLQDDAVLLNETVANLDKKLREQQKQIEFLHKLVSQSIEMNRALQSRNEMLESELNTAKAESYSSSSCLSCDGTYLWKITDFTQKLADAISEKQTSIYSPPFYSSPNGYKMCMRLYLQGDGQARRTHLSVFFVLLRGENDAVLPWPFDHRVIFCLFDQSPAKRHIIDSFRPDIKSNSFQRPRSAMNIASGIPRFFPLNVIQQSNNPYVRDDCMFIRCLVDFDSMPKQHVNTICTYNLALPTTRRNKEMEELINKANSKEKEDEKSEEEKTINSEELSIKSNC